MDSRGLRRTRARNQHTPCDTTSRRSFLRRAGLGGAAAVGAGALAAPLLGAPAAAALADEDAYDPDAADVAIAKAAISLELALVSIYDLADQVGLLDPQLTEVARAFGRHHGHHAGAFTDLLATIEHKVEGTTSTTMAIELDGSMEADARTQLDAVQTPDEIVTLLLGYEEQAAATYLRALEQLVDVPLAETAAGVLPVEGQHAVVWAQALDLAMSTAVPAFQTTADALDLSAMS